MDAGDDGMEPEFFAKIELDKMLERALKEVREAELRTFTALSSASESASTLTYEKLMATMRSIPQPRKVYLFELEDEWAEVLFLDRFGRDHQAPPYPWGSMFISHKTHQFLRQRFPDDYPSQWAAPIYPLILPIRQEIFAVMRAWKFATVLTKPKAEA